MKRDWAAVLFAMTFPTVLAWIYFVVLAGPSKKESWAVQVAYTGGKAIQFVFPLLWVWCATQRTPRPAWPTRRGMLAGLLFGVAVGVLAQGGIEILNYFFGDKLYPNNLEFEVHSKLKEKLGQFGLNQSGAYWRFALFLAVFHSLLEEYYWRWFVFGRLRLLVRLWPAIVASSLAFMAHHVIIVSAFFPARPGAGICLSLAVAVGGAFWARLYHQSGSLYATWLSHALVDLSILAVGAKLAFPPGPHG